MNRRLYDEMDGMISAFRTNYRLVLVDGPEDVERQRRRIVRQLRGGGNLGNILDPRLDVMGREFLGDYVGGIRCPDLAAYSGRFPVLVEDRPGGGKKFPLMIVDRKTCDGCPNRRRVRGRPACLFWPDERRSWNRSEAP